MGSLAVVAKSFPIAARVLLVETMNRTWAFAAKYSCNPPLAVAPMSFCVSENLCFVAAFQGIVGRANGFLQGWTIIKSVVVLAK